MTTATRPWTFRRVRNLGAGFVALMLIPGGLLLAVLAWLYRHGRKGDPT